jgi:alginate O-acetyltransferase complex protein AlgI
MVFSSALFLFLFLPIFFVVYFLAPAKHKNKVILVFSFLFYQWGAPQFVYLLLLVTFVDFFIVKKMDRANGRKRKMLLICSLLLNIGLLAYFKYANFFIENTNAALIAVGIKSVAWTNVVLPIGISFFAFETLTYAIDVYRRVHKPLVNVLDYYTYILLFPKLIAGPIVRFHEIADQISDRTAEDNIENKLIGFHRFIIGLAKKILIANVMAQIADTAFDSQVNPIGAYNAWLGAIAYSFQIYFDFSGYSDMAIGLGRMMGFRFIDNFNNPYISGSITEFWRRWHMSLGRWMRDYLYIPLGGNKGTKLRVFFNLWLVFLVSGLWHGAAWNFIAWGAFHGFFLIADRLFLLDFYNRIGKYPSVIITYIITLFGWVLFRSNNIESAKKYFYEMIQINTSTELHISNNYFTTIFLLAVVFSFSALSSKIERIQLAFYDGELINNHFYKTSIVMFLLLLLTLQFVISANFNPFIYFRF